LLGWQSVAKLFRRCGDDHDEEHQQEELGDFEGRFGLGGGQCVDCGHLLKGLCDKDEDVEVKRDEGGDDVGASPWSVEMEDVEREDGDREDYQ
jgi:hypothetical protein